MSEVGNKKPKARQLEPTLSHTLARHGLGLDS